MVKVGSSNGKTLDFDSSNGGSNPSPTSKEECKMKISELKASIKEISTGVFQGSTYKVELLKLEALVNINDSLEDISKQLKLMVKQWDEVE